MTAIELRESISQPWAGRDDNAPAAGALRRTAHHVRITDEQTTLPRLSFIVLDIHQGAPLHPQPSRTEAKATPR